VQTVLKIGNTTLATNLLLSPISGYCDLSFRLTVRRLGGLGLACTDLVNPRGLLEQTRKSLRIVQSDPADRPLCVQFYGHEADKMADAARWIRDHLEVDILDINMGCPAHKVCRRGSGAALLNNMSLGVGLARRVVEAVDIPVTAKMRLGWDDEHIVAPELSRQLEGVGVAGVIVHGRTAEQKFSGEVRLEEIAKVAEAVGSIPVIGNGDVCSAWDAKRMLDITGCVGVMIGRAALRDPWIFRDTHAFLTTGEVPAGPSVEERVALMNEHFEHLVRLRGERLACLTFRQRASWYCKKLNPPVEFRERVRFVSSAVEYYELVNSVLCRDWNLDTA
jgi:nifR3 family TIM-barrel protein